MRLRTIDLQFNLRVKERLAMVSVREFGTRARTPGQRSCADGIAGHALRPRAIRTGKRHQHAADGQTLVGRAPRSRAQHVSEGNPTAWNGS